MLQKMKRVVSLLLVMSLVVLSAPELTRTAAAAGWKLIVNPHTPLDRVYFFEDSDEGTTANVYGYIGNKVAILDDNLKLVKKTDYTGISYGKNFNKKRYHTVSKKVGKKTKQGIIDQKGNVVLAATHDVAGFYTIKDYYSQKQVGILTYTDGTKKTFTTLDKRKKYEKISNTSLCGIYNGSYYFMSKDAKGNEVVIKDNTTFYTLPSDAKWSGTYVYTTNKTTCIAVYWTKSDGMQERHYFDFTGKEIEDPEKSVSTTSLRGAWNGQITDTMVAGGYTFTRNTKGDTYYFTAKKSGKVVCSKVSISNGWSDFGTHQYEDLILVNNRSYTGTLKSFLYDMKKKKVVYQVKNVNTIISSFSNISTSGYKSVSLGTFNKKDLYVATTNLILGSGNKTNYSHYIPYKPKKINGTSYQMPVCGSEKIITFSKKKRIYVIEDETKATIKNVKYELSGNKAKVVGYTGKKSSLTIPQTITLNAKKYPVTQIAKKAFANHKKLKKLTVKTKKLTKVDSSAFQGTKQKIRVKVPSKVKKKYQRLFKKTGNNAVTIQ